MGHIKIGQDEYGSIRNTSRISEYSDVWCSFHASMCSLILLIFLILPYSPCPTLLWPTNCMVVVDFHTCSGTCGVFVFRATCTGHFLSNVWRQKYLALLLLSDLTLYFLQVFRFQSLYLSLHYSFVFTLFLYYLMYPNIAFTLNNWLFTSVRMLVLLYKYRFILALYIVFGTLYSFSTLYSF